jgi:hypothetical protein
MVKSCKGGFFFSKNTLKNRSDAFQWVLMVVYGAVQHKGCFLTELVNVISTETADFGRRRFSYYKKPMEKIATVMITGG